MLGEYIRFALSAVCMLGGAVTLIVALIGLLRFDFALNRIHAAAMADTLALLIRFLTQLRDEGEDAMFAALRAWLKEA